MRLGRWPNRAQAAFGIRDDDVSGFTEPAMLQTVHEAAFARGFKVSFSVVPFHAGVEDPNVPPPMRTSHRPVALHENPRLLEYLRRVVREEHAGVIMHGLSHERDEFDADEATVRARLVRGREELVSTLGFSPRVFVPPWESLNRSVYRAALGERYSLSMAAGPYLRFALRDPRTVRALRESFAFVRSTRLLTDPDVLPFGTECVLCPAFRFGDWYFPDRGTGPGPFEAWREKFETFCRAGRCFVLSTHYWQFFHDWDAGNPRRAMLDTFRAMLAHVDRRGDVWKATMADLADWASGFRALRVRRPTGRRTEITSERSMRGLTVHLDSGERWSANPAGVEPREVDEGEAGTAIVLDLVPGETLRIEGA